MINLSNNMRIIDDSYNANYESMIAAINYLNTFSSNKIIILVKLVNLESLVNKFI